MERLELAEWFNKLIGSEINAMLQYEIAASIVENKDAKDEFNQHANEERVHMKKLLKYANKIKLNLDQNLKTLVKNAYPEYENMNYKDDNNLLKFHIRGEQGAIKSYKEFLKEIKDDEVLSKLINEIIKDEEEHERDLKNISKKPKIFNY